MSKNPSTAAASYLPHNNPGGFQGRVTSGMGAGPRANDSFDLDIMMPPDVASIDSDISIFLYFL